MTWETKSSLSSPPSNHNTPFSLVAETVTSPRTSRPIVCQCEKGVFMTLVVNLHLHHCEKPPHKSQSVGEEVKLSWWRHPTCTKCIQADWQKITSHVNKNKDPFNHSLFLSGLCYYLASQFNCGWAPWIQINSKFGESTTGQKASSGDQLCHYGRGGE